METAMQELKSDLVLTKETTKNSFLEIENQEIREVCIGVFEITLNAIIKRIDTELLAMEKKQIMEFTNDYILTQCGASFEGNVEAGMLIEEYYKLTFKSE
jgi:glucosamine 6-phosphate synthetase-like amidotransferase/phosphosugar isomerase protein